MSYQINYIKVKTENMQQKVKCNLSGDRRDNESHSAQMQDTITKRV